MGSRSQEKKKMADAISQNAPQLISTKLADFLNGQRSELAGEDAAGDSNIAPNSLSKANESCLIISLAGLPANAPESPAEESGAVPEDPTASAGKETTIYLTFITPASKSR
jgi:hypothetical protein